MSRLIDAERLRKDILNLHDCYNGFSDTYDKACIIGVIDEQPTIDPVKHGRWVKAEPDGCWSYSEVYKQCSECGKVTFLAEKMNYCPNCGAKMDEVEK